MLGGGYSGSVSQRGSRKRRKDVVGSPKEAAVVKRVAGIAEPVVGRSDRVTE